MTPVLCFDIETVPDVAGLRVLLDADKHPGADELEDAEVVNIFTAARKEKTGHEFLPLHQHRVVAIACLLRAEDGLLVRCLGQPDDPEEKLLKLFFKQIERYTPQIVSWNGSGFDLPVMNYRCLIHGVDAARFWDMGDGDREFKWNNYISRYHSRHLDLMDLLAMYSPRANAPLDELVKLCGFPGKLGMDGSQVWAGYQAGKLGEIRDYCETDVANTYLMFCRYQLIRGQWDQARYERELQLLKDTLVEGGQEHWQVFLAAWKSA